MTPKEFFEYAEQNYAKMVDLKFTDLLGTWQHCSFPIDTWDEGTFEDGVGFDGSSIRGWQGIHNSDMLAIPDPSTATLDPFFKEPTVSVIADIVDPITRENYSRDPRYVARKGESFLKNTKIADTCYIGPEPEFFIFDEVMYEQNQHTGMYSINSVEGAWNTARFEEPNLGYKPSFKGGYFPVSPTDTYHDLRGEMVREMQKVGITVEAHHHEVATAGQSEIDMKFEPLTKMADQFMWFKYIIKNVAKRHNKTVTFMPKPIFQDNGSGMHTHFSLWKDGKPLFSDSEYAGLSKIGLYSIGGILKHAPAILAFAAPTTNSYRRLVPGFEAPVNLVMSARNRSAAVRIPMYSNNPKAKRLEFRCPDPTANGYLTWTAMLMAAVDGIKNKINPGEPLDRDIYNMTPEELAAYPKAPANLAEAINALENDHAFLLEGDVFTTDLIFTWIEWKRNKE
ncbi:MAG TPA: type I glutamate--ammonia ligase, partial [Candidatus Marinimicrobia bacterium]|nr:type I glutamate--ammonia ligase [Candidatus Neomarinimicrobiota bacterium]